MNTNQNVALIEAHVQPSASSSPKTARLRTAPGGSATGPSRRAPPTVRPTEPERRRSPSDGAADGAGAPDCAGQPTTGGGRRAPSQPALRPTTIRSTCIAA